MCLLTLVAGAFLVTIMTSPIIAFRGESERMGPPMSGAVCALAIVPPAMAAGSIVALPGLIITFLVGAIVGEWELRSALMRGVFGCVGFIGGTALIAFFKISGGESLVESLMLFSRLLTEILALLGILCN